MKKIIQFISLLLFSVGINSFAIDRPVEFDNNHDKQRYEKLIEETRCLVCQNQSLADSNAELAQDLRKQIHTMIITGKDSDEIKQFLTQRYGDFVLYRPPLKQSTWLLWFSPFLFLTTGIVVTILVIRKQRQSKNTNITISEKQKQRLQTVLNETLIEEDK